MAAPQKNLNAVRHGLKAGSLPKGCSYVAKITAEIRQSIERAVVEAKGEISLPDACRIQTFLRWERHALLAQRWLRMQAETMDANTVLTFSRDIAKASAERDKCLAALGIDKQQVSPAGGVTFDVAAVAVDEEDQDGHRDSDRDGDSERGRRGRKRLADRMADVEKPPSLVSGTDGLPAEDSEKVEKQEGHGTLTADVTPDGGCMPTE